MPPVLFRFLRRGTRRARTANPQFWGTFHSGSPRIGGFGGARRTGFPSRKAHQAGRQDSAPRQGAFGSSILLFRHPLKSPLGMQSPRRRTNKNVLGWGLGWKIPSWEGCPKGGVGGSTQPLNTFAAQRIAHYAADAHNRAARSCAAATPADLVSYPHTESCSRNG